MQLMPKKQAIETGSPFVGQHYFGSLPLNVIPNMAGKNQSTIATNCHNIMTETIGMIFCMARKGVKNPRYMTTEALEHMFGAFCAERREATILGFMEIEDKV